MRREVGILATRIHSGHGFPFCSASWADGANVRKDPARILPMLSDKGAFFWGGMPRMV